MKTCVTCVICHTVTAAAKTYKVKITEPIYIPNVPKSSAVVDTYTGRMCHHCSEKAGYSVGRKRKPKTEDQSTFNLGDK